MSGKREFNSHEALPWTEAKGQAQPGALEKILYRDQKQGTYVRLLKMPPGWKSGDTPLRHDFDEVVWVLEGYSVNPNTGQRNDTGMFAVFPTGVGHGPFIYPDGALFIEFRHYIKR